MATWTERLRGLAATLREPPALLALGFNFVPAVCVLLFGWSPAILILLYWAENVAIGLFHIFKMLVVGFRTGFWRGLLPIVTIAFFTVHYGLFCLGHGLFALTFLGFELGLPNTAEMPEQLLLSLPRYLEDERGFFVSLAAVAALQAVAFGQWLHSGAWRTADEDKIMMEPYGRLIALHISLFAMAFSLAVFKSVAEGIFAGRKARKQSSP